MTKRIRWEPGAEAGTTACFGLVAGCGPHLFQIIKPAFKGDQHVLRSELPGQRYSQRDGDPDTLKAAAEEWLTAFVSSLGAVFFPGDVASKREDVLRRFAPPGPSRPAEPVPSRPEEETGQ
jgi:hypothetical protein